MTEIQATQRVFLMGQCACPYVPPASQERVSEGFFGSKSKWDSVPVPASHLSGKEKEDCQDKQ